MEFLSLAALFGVIALSYFSKVNPGLLSFGLAWLLGHYGAHMSVNQIAAGFPTYMFIVLVGVTYLFGLAKHNGTLEKLARVALGMVKGKPMVTPLLFFILAAILSTIGAGNIGAVALLAPVAMTIAWETGIGAFFMTIAIVTGANAGTFSPFALTGIVANGLIAKLGLTMDPWKEIFIPNLLAQTFLAALCYALFYWKIKHSRKYLHAGEIKIPVSKPEWSQHQKFTLIAIITLIACTVFLKTDIGFLSIVLDCGLTLLNVPDGREAIKQIPWDIIILLPLSLLLLPASFRHSRVLRE